MAFSIGISANPGYCFISQLWPRRPTLEADLDLVVKEDGVRVSIPVDCFIFLPACPSLARIYKNTPNSDFYKQQVILTGVRAEAVKAVVDLVYSGCCSLEQVTHAEVEQVIALTGMKMKEGSLVVEVVEGTGMVESRGESVGPDVGEARIGDVNQETSVDLRKTTIDVDKENNVRKTRTVDANNWRNVTTQDKRLAPLLCRQCHQRFGDAKNEKDRSAFNAHLWEPHDFACRYCKYIKFTSADELDEHVARACWASQPMEGWSIYKGKSYNCNFCRLKFTRKRALGDHQARPHTVPCEFCQLKFTKETFLQEHMDTAHETEERSTDDTVEEESVTTLVGEGREKQSKKKPNYFLNESDDEESDEDDHDYAVGSGSPGSSIVPPLLVRSLNQHGMGNQGMPAAIDLTQDNDMDLAEEDVTLGERQRRIRNRADLSEITEDFCEEPVEQDGDDQTDASQQLLTGANGGDKEPPRKRARMGGDKRAIAEGEEGSAVSEEEEEVCRGQRRSSRRNSPGLTKGYFKGMDIYFDFFGLKTLKFLN